MARSSHVACLLPSLRPIPTELTRCNTTVAHLPIAKSEAMITQRRHFTRTLATLVAGLALLAAGSARAAGPGSAGISPSASVAAGSTGSWVIFYTDPVGFPHNAFGGVVEIEIPAGWTPPTISPGQPGEVTATSPSVGSISIVPPRPIHLDVGAAAVAKFVAGDTLFVTYGGSGGAAATASTSAPDSSLFRVSSDADAQGGVTLIEATGSPLPIPVVPA